MPDSRLSQNDDSAGRRDAQESIRRAAGAQAGEPRLNTPTERALYRDCAYYKAERDRYRAALEQIAGHFVPYQRRTYGPVDITLDAIRREVEEALADD